MNKDVLKFVDSIIDRLTNSSIFALEVEVEGVKVRAEKATAVQTVVASTVAQPVAQNQTIATLVDNIQAVNATVERGKIVKSPIVGTCYLSPGPDQPEYVSVGSSVKKGDVVLIVEAMKIMNEIESEFAGTVKQILVNNGELVEFGQPLMIID